MEPPAPAYPKELLTALFFAALHAADPYAAVKRRSAALHAAYEACACDRLFVVGFGKAACPMAKAVEEVFGERISSGIIITKYGHCTAPVAPRKIKVVEAAHPVPDENGLRGAQEIMELLARSDEKTLVLCLLSGGGSALCVAPADSLQLSEKQAVTELLLRAGATVDELNTVRKHLSRLKGGRLAELAAPSKVVSLVLSDVIGDRLDVIASGPTAPDPSTYQDALNILDRSLLLECMPPLALEIIYRGVGGHWPETPKEGAGIFARVENIIIGSNRQALAAAQEKAASLSLDTALLSSELSGEAREAGRRLAQRAREAQAARTGTRPGGPLCLISGGETTVRVTGTGRGGRNTELALAFALEIAGTRGITLLSAGTDGTDGPTDAAGAIVDGGTVARGEASGLSARASLLNNDSYTFLKGAGELLVTGPTGTNVMDLQLALIW